jgi:hypothetical protein
MTLLCLPSKVGVLEPEETSVTRQQLGKRSSGNEYTRSNRSTVRRGVSSAIHVYQVICSETKGD